MNRLVVVALVLIGVCVGIVGGVGAAYYRVRIRNVYHRITGRGQNTPALVKHGEQVFATTCGTGYCHGPQGRGGGAPALQARQGFDQTYITNAVTGGIPGTPMPGFAKDLSRSDLMAVVAYVSNLNGITYVPSDSVSDAPAQREMTGESAVGRHLFSDSLRSFERCSTCHEVSGTGIPIAPPIPHTPGSVEALRSLTTPDIATVTLQGESMPALIVSKTAGETMFYDLTVPPPVLRTADPASVKIASGSSWKHSSTLAGYSDAELGSILSFLRAGKK